MNREKELELDEKFVVEARSTHSDTSALRASLEHYFAKKYWGVMISFDDVMQEWKISTRKGTKLVGLVESIPKTVQELL
jgi:hypothetical protein